MVLFCPLCNGYLSNRKHRVAYTGLRTSYMAEDKKQVAELAYRHIWQQSTSGLFALG